VTRARESLEEAHAEATRIATRIGAIDTELARLEAARGARAVLGDLFQAIEDVLTVAVQHAPRVPAELKPPMTKLAALVGEVDELDGADRDDGLTGERDTLLQEAQGVQVQVGVAQRQAAAAQRAHDALKGRQQGAMARATTAELQRDQWVAADGERARREVQAADQLQAIEVELGELAPTGHQGTAEQQIGVLNAERVEVLRNIDKLNDHASAAVEAESARLGLGAATSKRADIRAAGEAVRDLLGQRLQAAVAPLLDPVNEHLFPALGGQGLSIRLGKGAHLELQPSGTPLASASTSERVCALMLLQAAVHARQGGWRHVLVDDLEHLDHERRTAFVGAMAAWMEAGELDTFIGACVDDGWTPPPGVDVVRLPFVE
jgi:hypothetical protein